MSEKKYTVHSYSDFKKCFNLSQTLFWRKEHNVFFSQFYKIHKFNFSDEKMPYRIISSSQPTFVGCGPPHQLYKQQLTPPPPSHPPVMEGRQERGGSTTTCADSPRQQQSGNQRTVTPPPLANARARAGGPTRGPHAAPPPRRGVAGLV